MTDISKCSNDSCSLKEMCYRYKAKPNSSMQSYGQFKQNKDKTCDYYWEVKQESNGQDQSR